MQKSTIYYFEKPGEENTPSVFQAVKERLEKGDIQYVLIASSSGMTALKLINTLKDYNIKIVVVTLHAGFETGDELEMPDQIMKQIKDSGAQIVISSHAFSGVGRSISRKFGGVSHVEIISHTLRLFCGHGIKVAVEISIMAADAGKIPTNQDIISIAGTDNGCDTAIVLKAAHMNNLFDLEIREILAKPIRQEL